MDRPTIPLLTWEAVRSIIEEGMLEKLGRSNEQHAEYVAFRNSLNEKWETVTDYLLATKFSYAQSKSEVSGKFFVVKPPTVDEDRLYLAPNDFPYNFAAGIEHHILWKLGKPITDEEIADAALRLKEERAPHCVDFVT
jgi:hypothetical protein